MDIPQIFAIDFPWKNPKVTRPRCKIPANCAKATGSSQGPSSAFLPRGGAVGWVGSLRENPEIARENGDFIGFHRIYGTEHGDLYSFMGFKWFNRIDSFHESFVWIYGIEHGTLQKWKRHSTKKWDWSCDKEGISMHQNTAKWGIQPRRTNKMQIADCCTKKQPQFHKQKMEI